VGSHRVAKSNYCKIWREMSFSTVFCFVCLFAAACSPTKITTVNVKSPDGSWIATGRTYDTVGPGINDLSTEITLTSTMGSSPETTLLVFKNESPLPNIPPVKFTLSWLTPHHLVVQFNWIPKFVKRIDKDADVEISVEASSGAPDFTK
jgi:hypothetical protein